MVDTGKGVKRISVKTVIENDLNLGGRARISFLIPENQATIKLKYFLI
jgi:hypothetical protein